MVVSPSVLLRKQTHSVGQIRHASGMAVGKDYKVLDSNYAHNQETSRSASNPGPNSTGNRGAPQTGGESRNGEASRVIARISTRIRLDLAIPRTYLFESNDTPMTVIESSEHSYRRTPGIML